MFQHDQVFTKTDLAKQSVSASENFFQKEILFDGSKDSIQKRKKFFWTKHQRELIEKDPKRVLFTSNYGTGKTLVMKAKAMQLCKQRQLFFASKKEADQGNEIDFSESFLLEKSAMQIEKKEPFNLNLKNQTNGSSLIDPGKTFIILFSKPDALLFHSIHQEFEELKDHVQVICYTG
jgi:hypothetical protein